MFKVTWNVGQSWHGVQEIGSLERNDRGLLFDAQNRVLIPSRQRVVYLIPFLPRSLDWRWKFLESREDSQFVDRSKGEILVDPGGSEFWKLHNYHNQKRLWRSDHKIINENPENTVYEPLVENKPKVLNDDQKGESKKERKTWKVFYRATISKSSQNSSLI